MGEPEEFESDEWVGEVMVDHDLEPGPLTREKLEGFGVLVPPNLVVKRAVA